MAIRAAAVSGRSAQTALQDLVDLNWGSTEVSTRSRIPSRLFLSIELWQSKDIILLPRLSSSFSVAAVMVR